MGTFTITGSGPVWSKGTTSVGSEVFVPMTAWIPAANVSKVRAMVEMKATNSSDIKIAPAFETANDVEGTTTAGSAIGSYRTTEGFNYAGSWSDISSTTGAAQWIRFGIFVLNIAGSTHDMAWGSFKIDVMTP